MTQRTVTGRSWRKRLAPLLAAAMIPVAAAGCAKAPATGERIFTGGMSPQDERRLGAEQHPKMVKQFGGAFENQTIQAYVQDIGQRLAKESELPNLDWTFTVLDAPIVNAFALPGGYVYVTRELVALAENEAELAGVLAHEIGHVTARHSAERYGGTLLANIAGVASAVFLGRQASQAVGTLGNVALSGYSRSQEFQADTLGVRYIRRAGYDPEGMASFLAKMQANSQLQATLQGTPEAADQFDIMQTHPRTSARVKEAIAAARNGPVAGEDGRAVYLAKLDGMRYSDSADQGFVRRRDFLHPDLRFAFTVPEGFRILNRPDQVVALGPNDAIILFTADRLDRSMAPHAYLTRVWAENARLSQVERLSVNDMAAATGTTRLRTNGGTADARLVAIRYDKQRMYRFTFVTPLGVTSQMNDAFRRTTHSFRRLSEAEAAALEPLRLTVHTVQEGETVARLAEKMPFGDFRERRFRVLNGLDADDELQVGDKVKLIVANAADS